MVFTYLLGNSPRTLPESQHSLTSAFYIVCTEGLTSVLISYQSYSTLLKVYFLLYDDTTSIILGKAGCRIIDDGRISKTLVQKIFFVVNFVPKIYFYFYLIVCFMNYKVKWLENATYFPKM